MYTTNPQKKQSNFDSIYNVIFNSLPGNALVIDIDRQIVKTNANWNKFAVKQGLDANNEWIGQDYLEVCQKLMGNSKEWTSEACKGIKAILSGEESNFELDYQGPKSGETKWFRMQASGFEFEGSFFATIIHQDISEYSNAKMALKESENNLQETNKQLLAEISEKKLSEYRTQKSELDFNLLANSSPGVMYTCSLDDPWEMHFISDKIEILSGYPKEDFLGLNPIRPFGEIMHSDDREEASRLVQIAIKNKESYKLAYRVIHSDGHIKYVFGYGQATYKRDGSPDYLVGVIFNDTDRVVALNKVKESEENYRTLIQQANDGIVVLQDAKIKFANSALTRITGYSVEELTESNFIDFIDEKELAKVKANYVKRMNGESVGIYESRIVHKNGHVIDVEFNGRLTQYNGQIADLVMVRDISVRKKAEKELLISEERYRLLFTGSQNGILFTDTDTMQIKYANPAISKILGYSEKELLQMRVPDIHPTNSHELVIQEFNVHIKEEPNFVYALPCLTKDNKIIYANVSASELTTSSGKFRVGFFTDITKYILAEEERNRIFNLSNDLIGIAGFDGIMKQLNPAWEKTLGYSLLELTKKPFMDFVHDEDHEKTKVEMKKLASGQATINFENRYMHKDGSIRHISWSATPATDQALIYCIGRDVTERKEIDSQVLQYQKRLKDQAIELTLAEEKQRKEIAVDLHDQVGQLLAYSRMQIAALTPHLSKENILDQTIDISKGLLSAIETTRNVIFNLSPPQLEELGLYAAIADWMEEEIEKKTKIEVSISGEEQRYPLNDNMRILLFRSVRELLINTVKHAGATKLNVNLDYKEDVLQISVTDNGIGFSYQPEQLKLRQSGFGLFSVFERVGDLGGHMGIKTSPGKGTQIELNIPINQR